MACCPHYIVIVRKSQLLMNFLDIRVVVGDKIVCSIQKNKPVVIPVKESLPEIVVSDGFHYTPPMKLNTTHPVIEYLYIGCAIDDELLTVGIVVWLLFGGAGMISNILIFKIISFVPVFYFLFCFYGRRREYIKLDRR